MEIAALDALDLLVVADNENDTLSSVDKGVPQSSPSVTEAIEWECLGRPA